MKITDFLNVYANDGLYLTDTEYDVLAYVELPLWDSTCRVINSLDRLLGAVSRINYSRDLGAVVVHLNLGEVLDSNPRIAEILQKHFPKSDICWDGDSYDVISTLACSLEYEDDEVLDVMADCFDEIVDLGLHLK